MRLLILIGLMLACPGTAQAQPAREVPVAQHIDWTMAPGASARYRSGGVTLTFRSRAAANLEGLLEPVLTAELPGFAPVQAVGVATQARSEHRAAVGNGPRGPFVFFQSYSGGAHCCVNMQLIEPGADAAGIVSFGDWDGGYIDQMPEDLDGDGALDLVLTDDRFLYAFTSYAESMPPPRIMSAIGGRAVDVSTRPAFRRFFQNAMAAARRECVEPSEGRSANGACAAYVASAARLGRFEEAWQLMLREYDREYEWVYSGGCRSAVVDGQCPQGQQVEYRSFPEALRALLIEANYIRR
jgi:hypothetical protein